ncbi:MAG TPA: biotin transporter BioY [Candidatus Obscuribacterales bacterium]
MTIRYLVKLELAALFLSLLILATFIQLRLPFISFQLPQLPDTWLWDRLSWPYVWTYSGNLQIPMVFLMLVVLDGALASLTLGAYLLLGLCAFPIFFYGGGWAYLHQPTFGYLAALLPSAWLWMFTLRRHPRRAIPIKRYIWASLMSLGLIHLFGGLWAALYYQLIPLEFLLNFVLPQLTWQLPSMLFVVLVVVQLKEMLREPPPRRRSASHA